MIFVEFDNLWVNIRELVSVHKTPVSVNSDQHVLKVVAKNGTVWFVQNETSIEKITKTLSYYSLMLDEEEDL